MLRKDCFLAIVAGFEEALRAAAMRNERAHLVAVVVTGGVSDRVLNQFYATAGVSFTTNHTYWHDDALLWDSVVAKRPGMPNITGETGYQPAWDADGAWRYDELTDTGIEERSTLYSSTEFKKIRLLYFTGEYRAWEREHAGV